MRRCMTSWAVQSQTVFGESEISLHICKDGIVWGMSIMVVYENGCQVLLPRTVESDLKSRAF